MILNGTETKKFEVRPSVQSVLTLSIMDPFTTPFTTPPRWKHQFPREGIKLIHKREIVAFIESMSFEYIQIPIEMTVSTDEALTTSFVQAFCDALADSLIKAAPSESSPKKLIEQITSLPIDTPTKIPTKADKPKQIASAGLQDKLALFPTVYGGIPTGKKMSIIPFACPLLINKGKRPSRHRRPRLQYPVDDSPIAPIPDHIARVFAQETASVLKTYKPPYTLCPLYEHEEDPLPFLWINAVIHPYTLSPEFTATMRRYNNQIKVDSDSMFDTGNAITRICADVVGFKLDPGDQEPCILTFTYLPRAFGNDVQSPRCRF